MYNNPYKGKKNNLDVEKDDKIEQFDSENLSEKNTKEEQDQENNTKENDVIKDLEQQIIDLKSKIVYLAAENENTRKRLLQEKSEAINFANGKILSSFVDPIECLYLAIQSINSDVEADSVIKSTKEGLSMTIAKFEQLFSQNNITRMYPINQKFDYKLHQAISEIENESEAGNIINVVSAGYSLNGFVVKPAMVVVSKGKK